jgi:GT2 family glycosyltransferase
VSLSLDPPRVSVVIAAADEGRWLDLVEAVESVERQSVSSLETIVAVDNNDLLLARVREELPSVVATPNRGPRGASATRNAGVAVARGGFVAFIDDDAVAEPGWLENLLHHFGDEHVIGAGGKVLAQWAGDHPRWFPEEFGWVVGASYRGMPTAVAPVRNVWTNNMVIRREAFDRAGGFLADFSKVGDASRPEDTELCVRAAASWPGGRWLYDPRAIVHHKVPLSRATPRFFLERCFAEGAGKAELYAVSESADVSRTERRYLVESLTGGIGRNVGRAVRGLDPAACSRIVAIIVGMASAAVGFCVARMRGRRSGGSVPATPGSQG